MSTCMPRRSWQSSMIGPTKSGGVMIGGPDVGLLDRLDQVRVGHVGRAVHVDPLAAAQAHVVLDVRRRREQLEAVLALEPLAHDVHVQQAEEAAAKAEAERLRGLGLVRERRVVQRQLLERVPQVGVAVGVDRIEAAEDDRAHLAVAGQRLGGRPASVVSVSPTRSFATSLMPVMM